MRYRIPPHLFLIVAPLTGCFGPEPVKTELATAATEVDLPTASKLASNAFATELLAHEAKGGAPNYVVCPPAARKCLSVAAFLARGETRAGLAKAAHLPVEDRALETEGLAQSSNVNPDPVRPFEKTEVFLDSATLKLNPGYESKLEHPWGVAFTPVSFADPAKVLRRMNGEIENDDGSITQYDSPVSGTPIPLPFSVEDIAAARDEKTGLMLVSRTHFRSRWDKGFPERATREDSFRMANGEAIRVPMMNLVEDLPCAKLPTAKLIRLPYNANDATLLLLLPDEGANGLETMAALMRGAPESWKSKLTKHHATLALPRFDITHRAKLSAFAKTHGAATAFDKASCDYSAGLAVVSPGAIKPAAGDIRQDAYFKIDEELTEAGSVTGMSFSCVFGSRPKPKYPDMTLRFDRPFGFILEREGLILFAGWCGKPASISAKDLDQFALNAIADSLDATIRRHWAKNCDTPIKVSTIAHTLQSADGKKAVLKWKEGPDTFVVDTSTPDAVLPHSVLNYKLTFDRNRPDEVSCDYWMPARPHFRKTPVANAE